MTEQRLGDVMDAFFEQYYRSHPVNATFTGVHEFDAGLPDWSAAGRAREAGELQTMLDAFPPMGKMQSVLVGLPATEDSQSLLHEIHGASTDAIRGLSRDDDALDALLAEANLRLRLLEHSSGHFHRRNPALYTGEAIFGVVSLMIRDFAPAASRAFAMTARLNGVPAFLQAMRTDMTQSVPEQWRDRAMRECRVAGELFGSGLEMWIAEHLHMAGQHAADADDVVTPLRQAAQRACDAFLGTGAWLQQCAVAEPADYAIGVHHYGEILRLGHFCNEAPAALLQRAEQELDRERVRLGAMLGAKWPVTGGAGAPLATADADTRDAAPHNGPTHTGATSTGATLDADGMPADPLRHWPLAQAELAADRPTTAAYYSSFARRWQEIHRGVLSADAVNWPDWPITFVPIPTWARQAAPQLYWLFYRSPAPFDRYETYEYLVTPIDETLSADEQTKRLSAWNHSTITLNHVVHHGGVGHHLQNWNAIHRSRSRVGTVAAVDCANRIGMFLGGSMAEGWACYATELVEELGLLTPLEGLAQQHTRVRQLARAVADIKLHTTAWTFAKCAQFYVQQTGMSPDAADAETTKNSMFPGTAIMYWLGTQGILDLRTAMRERLGAQFEARAFHDELLSRGAIPVLLAAKLMLSQ